MPANFMTGPFLDVLGFATADLTAARRLLAELAQG
jgi:hypothetical protein